ncbi:NADH-quinone oxidoreductase subunit C [Oceanispirochaeta sp.]|jgi:NADH-quinone oxidoreductase subunit C|uniref:NADH-quinone oxidoreductase subunit C n=1 Tax=Oceanispirochaeta sp. TaxID=2035350 RepID=UPI00260D1110|nr:NADH-quinone oxidoreductase subunit C [Oceanispirochaeta sp.]MDA3955728.1 NADH-quinone oxidoreductase subunit C [Oceanispirochaeta sp.]
MTELMTRLNERFPVEKTDKKSESQIFLTLHKNQAGQLITWLKDMEGFKHLIMVTCVDWPERNHMVLHYLLHNHDTNMDMGVLVEIEREKPEMDDLHHLWSQMATYQRELFEMYGINLPGSPRLTEAFYLEVWKEIPPMRREFDTKKYSEETFFARPGRSTNDPADTMRKELYPGRSEL